MVRKKKNLQQEVDYKVSVFSRLIYRLLEFKAFKREHPDQLTLHSTVLWQDLDTLGGDKKVRVVESYDELVSREI